MAARLRLIIADGIFCGVLNNCRGDDQAEFISNENGPTCCKAIPFQIDAKDQLRGLPYSPVQVQPAS